jgi:hypothetical protein
MEDPEPNKITPTPRKQPRIVGDRSPKERLSPKVNGINRVEAPSSVRSWSGSEKSDYSGDGMNYGN